MSTRLVGAPSCCSVFDRHAQRPAAAINSRVPPARAAYTSSQSTARLRALLEQVDGALSKGNDETALSLVRGSQGKDGGLMGFGAARQVPQRLYKLNELKLNGIDTSSLLSPMDTTVGKIERNLQLSALLGGLSISYTLELSQLQILFFVLGLLSLWSMDFVYFGGGLRNMVLDTIGHYLSQKYHNRVIQHEAGHFLIAYLLGVLPKGYTITSLDTLIKQGSLNVQAGTAFVDFEFLEEINAGKLSATVRITETCFFLNKKQTLNKFSCIALAGVATEYLMYGIAEGGLADINQLDELLNSLGFTQKKAESQVRWAVLNTVSILRRHEKARSHLAEAMYLGKSVGSCIEVIEGNISTVDI